VKNENECSRERKLTIERSLLANVSGQRGNKSEYVQFVTHVHIKVSINIIKSFTDDIFCERS
jgi:hypothetical protein